MLLLLLVFVLVLMFCPMQRITGSIRHQRARHTRFWDPRSPRGRPQFTPPRAASVRVPPVYHDRHLSAKFLLAIVDPNGRHEGKRSLSFQEAINIQYFQYLC